MLKLFASSRTLCAPKGAIVVLHGPSGSGKTLWLRRLAGLASWPESIHASLNDRRWPPKKMHGVFFLPDARPPVWLGSTVLEEIAFGLGYALDQQKAGEALAHWRCAASVDTPTSMLGKEQALRLRLAAMQLANPRLVLLDDPVSFLEERTRRALLAQLRAWAQAQQAVVVAADERWQDWQAVAHAFWRCTTPNALPVEDGRE